MKTTEITNRQALAPSLSERAGVRPYITPQVEIIELETTNHLMTGSLRGDSIADPETGSGRDGFDWGGWGK